MTKYIKQPAQEKNYPLTHLTRTGANPMYEKHVSDTFKIKTTSPWLKMAGVKK